MSTAEKIDAISSHNFWGITHSLLFILPEAHVCLCLHMNACVGACAFAYECVWVRVCGGVDYEGQREKDCSCRCRGPFESGWVSLCVCVSLWDVCESVRVFVHVRVTVIVCSKENQGETWSQSKAQIDGKLAALDGKINEIGRPYIWIENWPQYFWSLRD